MTRSDRVRLAHPRPAHSPFCIVVALMLCSGGCNEQEPSHDQGQNAAMGGSDGGAPSEDAASADAAASGSECTRASLTGAIDAYLAALAAQDPARLPVASDVRFTENGARRELGEGLWQTVSEVKFHRNVLDPERCGAVVQAVVTQAGSAAVLGLRLKLTAGKITEIETIVAGKEQDEDPAAFVPLQTDVIVNTPQPEWEQPVPSAERNNREELNHIADLYFDGFVTAGTPEFVPVPFAESCHRWENGLQTTKDTGGCITTFDGRMGSSFGAVTHRRYPVTDVENGVAVGFVNFANLWVDFHMLKISGGKIQIMQAVLSSFASTDRSTGWEDQEGADR
jgi:hypothetical protein